MDKRVGGNLYCIRNMPLLSRPPKNKNLGVLLHPTTVTTRIVTFSSFFVFGIWIHFLNDPNGCYRFGEREHPNTKPPSQQVLPHIAVQKPRAAWRQREVFPWLKDFKIRQKVAELHRTSLNSEPLISPHQILFGIFLFGMNPPLLSPPTAAVFLGAGRTCQTERWEPRSVPHGCVRRKGRTKQEPAGEIEGDKDVRSAQPT